MRAEHRSASVGTTTGFAAVQVVSDLGQLAAEKYDLWMVDVYLAGVAVGRLTPSTMDHVNTGATAERSVSLIDVRPQPTSVVVTWASWGVLLTR